MPYIECENCGKAFAQSNEKLKRNKHNFCSRPCFFDAQKKGIISQPPHPPNHCLGSRSLKHRTHIPQETWKVAYLAGLFDGEGCITFRNGQGHHAEASPQLSIVNTNHEAMKWVRETFGGGSGRVVDQGSRGLHRKPCYVIYYEAILEMKDLLEAMMPYLIIKKQKALESLTLIENRLSKSKGWGLAPNV